MSGKKKSAGKQIALCLLLTAAVDGLGVLLVTLLAVKGIVGEDRVPQALGALAFCAAFAGGLPAGKGRLGPGGSLLNAGAFALLLILLCFGGWGEGIAVRGLILLALILLGGLLAALLCGKVGKRSISIISISPQAGHPGYIGFSGISQMAGQAPGASRPNRAPTSIRCPGPKAIFPKLHIPPHL